MSNRERLQGALKLLGYEHSVEPFDRSNLVLAIQFFAGIQKDAALETECEVEIKNIRAEIEENRRQQA